MTTTATHTVTVDGVGLVEVTVADYGSGQAFLLLHGGAGPQSMTGFAELFAATQDVRVLAPIHPGFGGTPRSEALVGIRPPRPVPRPPRPTGPDRRHHHR